MEIEIILKTKKDTQRLAESIARQVKTGDVIALYGELGAGKTFFAQAFCRALGVEEYVSSPSFVIMNEYAGKFPVAHLDLYRLAAEEEIYELGLEDIMEQRVTIIEWPEIAQNILPLQTIHIHFKLDGDIRIVKLIRT
ncbi:MAG: tRNA (adenosine(37)-N6)-threonylcarbamoyltransferase complex ATPase subunit type 1 TsaE [Candidatus Cloacimonetes bacterium]|nr:tRNA (adenosine(37)-N6)-threonylcarbamoyltransferase complex ATPase subunit type 1 TsaE [Candidatus Cloacimonadota bacterium]